MEPTTPTWPFRHVWRKLLQKQERERAFVVALVDDLTSAASMDAFARDLAAEALGESVLLVRVEGERWRMVNDPAERGRLEDTLPENDRRVVYTRDPSPEAFQILMEAYHGPWA